MVNIESASVLFGSLSAVGTDFIALSNGFRFTHPKRIINWISVFSEVFADIVVGVFTTIPEDFTFSGTETGGVLFTSLAAHFTKRKWLSFGYPPTLAGTKSVSVFLAVICASKRFAASLTNQRWVALTFPIAFVGAKLSHLCPFFHRHGWLLSKFLAAPKTVFGKYFSHSRSIPQAAMYTRSNV